jgi:hypothetical protein
MGCGGCGGGRNRQNTHWQVTYPDGRQETYPEISKARIEAGKVKGSTLKAVAAPKTA